MHVPRRLRPSGVCARGTTMKLSAVTDFTSRTRCVAQFTCNSLASPPSRALSGDRRRGTIKHTRLLAPRNPILGFSQTRTPVIAAANASGSVAASPTMVRVRYVRRDRVYSSWGLHVWGDVTEHTDWQRPLSPQGLDAEGVYWEVKLRPGARKLGLLVHCGDTKSAGAELQVSELVEGSEVWLAGDQQQAFVGAKPDLSRLPVGSVNKSAAVWVSRDVIAWRHALRDTEGARSFTLHVRQGAGMWVNADGVQGAEQSFPLEPLAPALPQDLADKWPYLAGCSALRLPAKALEQVSSLVQAQLMVSVASASGSAMDATGLQLQGGLDAHFSYDGPLGVSQDPTTGQITVAVWAPTAQSLELLQWAGPRGSEQPRVQAMQRGALGPGVWSCSLPPSALFTFYKFRVRVYCPQSVRMEVSEATDPYSRSLAADGERSQIVPPDLEHPLLMPPGWHGHDVPRVAAWTDISLYELHIRDFSAADDSVPEALRGTYLAFVPDRVRPGGGPQAGLTHGLAHLQRLRQAGMNHLHLLPTYDFGSVPERREEQLVVKEELSGEAGDSERPQAAVLAVADRDAFNWGYDPVHYGVPEGSYATDPDGAPRIVQFREMVMALHQQGWRVVLDVVYNHTFAAGPSSRHSVLDKLVPGYYHRRMEDGEMCHSTCCNNTASEHYMAERLVVEDIVHWARHYKIDGFRFDIMGHLMVSTLAKMRAGLDALTPERDGVDGKSIYIYGEAWDFGEVVNNARGINCGQMNLAGTKLGAFNDRLRDGALGGGPFQPHDFQGFVTGLALAPSSCRGQGGPEAQLQELLQLSDWLRYSLAGNLRAFPLETSSGQVLRGEDAKAHGLPLAYGAEPCEHIAFIGCHDNLTMFDTITEKAPLTAFAEERMRMQVMCLALILLSQGIPFIHAGDDLLRSKSLDRDSYNSGDYFNAVDWTGSTHKLGIGLPVHTKNGGGWHYKRPLLTNPLIKPSAAHIQTSAAITQQLLRIRYSSPLFRLPTQAAVLDQVSFTNTGPDQVPGVIVMQLESALGTDMTGSVYDPNFERLVVVFNAAPLSQEVPYPSSAHQLVLHPLQAEEGAPDRRAAASRADDSSRTLFVPARTTAVFVTHQ
ncbi:glycoside hydrolase superfamily [Haematococcus lacustris]